MAEVIPFSCYRPVSELAAAVAAAPYDTFSRAEAAEEIARRPHSFLRIDKPAALLPDDVDEYAPEVYARARQELKNDLAAGIFVTDSAGGAPSDHYYVYRLSQADHIQIGLVACVAAADYDSSVIKRHENTRAHKQQDRVRHIEAVEAHTGPVLLTHRSDPAVDIALQAATTEPPLYDFIAADGTRHQVWRITDDGLTKNIRAAFNQLDSLYIADGHHRAAAAALIARERANPQSPHNVISKQANLSSGTHPPQPLAAPDSAAHQAFASVSPAFTRPVFDDALDPAHQPSASDPAHFLAVLFGSDQLRIHDYNRVVLHLGGYSPSQLLELIAARFAVRTLGPAPSRPSRPGAFSMYLRGTWYGLTLPESQRPADVVEGLDVALLHSRLLAPILGIDDPRSDPNIIYVGGTRGLDELAQRADRGGGVAFALHPPTLSELFAVADAGRLMPPKSTWFAPKPCSGLFIHRL